MSNEPKTTKEAELLLLTPEMGKRVARKLRESISVNETTNCHITSLPSGQFRPVVRVKQWNVYASRAAYILHNKMIIPDKLVVRHGELCATLQEGHKCINPLHLCIGTPKDNYDDMVKHGKRKLAYTKSK